MKQHWKREGFFKDDRGVALTEFVMVIPIVLLLFFAMQQYYVIVRTTQLTNYAAYTAARSYSVRIKATQAPKDYISAKSAAQSAAAEAMSPVATFSRLPGSSGSGLTTLAANFATAKVMFSTLPGIFSATTGKVGSHDQAVVTINYPQPINVPIFSSIWNFVTGQSLKTAMFPLGNSTAWGLSLTGMPYINVLGKCSTGCEKWSGVAQKINKNPPKWTK